MNSQSNTNDLQKAIDEITGNAATNAGAGDVAAELESKIKDQMGTPPVPPSFGAPAGEPIMPAEPTTDNAGVAAALGEAPAPEGAPNFDEGASGAPSLGDETPAITSHGGPVADAVASEPAPETASPSFNVPEMPTVAPEIAGDSKAESIEVKSGGKTAENAAPKVELPEDLAKVKESALQELVPLMDKVNISATERFGIYTEVIESTHDKSIVEKAFEAARAIEDEKTKAESLLHLVQLIDTL